MDRDTTLFNTRVNKNKTMAMVNGYYMPDINTASRVDAVIYDHTIGNHEQLGDENIRRMRPGISAMTNHEHAVNNRKLTQHFAKNQ